MTLLSFVMSAMLLLSPGRDHTELGKAIADVIEEKGCLYTGKDCERRSAAMLVAIAFRESSFRIDAENKKEGSVCAFQIWKGDRRLLSDPAACTLAGYLKLKESLRACGSMAGYASGSCTNAAGIRIDRDRKNIAMRLLSKL